MMTQKRQTALKYTLLTAAAGLIIACWLALAGAGRGLRAGRSAGEHERTHTYSHGALAWRYPIAI